MKGAGLLAVIAALVLAAALSVCDAATDPGMPPIDRHALVTRHNPVLRQFDAESPLSVGNGEFAFTADVTGLQTFAEAFDNTTPLGTLSQWGWHTFPNPNGWSIDKFAFKMFDVFGRKVGYADVPRNQRTPEIDWLRANPHRLHLGRIGFVLTKADGSAARTNDLGGIEQTLDMWNGVLVSHFTFEGQPVEVQTICHPMLDLLAVRVTSPLLRRGRIGIKIHFPYGTGATTTADWSKPDAHETILKQPQPNRAEFSRRLDNDTYSVGAAWTPGAALTEIAKHTYVLGSATNLDTLDFGCAFSPKPASGELPDFEQTREAARAHWNRFWTSGGAIDLSLSRDPRWRELERRIVLSQYLTAIQCAGSLPPQETGLTYNSWEGKFHLEMHWWHAAQFALWDRLALLEKSLGYYQSILPRARATAKRQGYAGARWPKMTSPDGAESPSPVGPFLIWQQPHPIFYAELCYRTHPDRATLEKYEEIVNETAEFMASYATWDRATKRFVLGPVLQCSQEIFPKDKTLNPTFELTYWRWGLETAQRWRERLGLPREPKWDGVLSGLTKPAVSDGKYLFTETTPDCYQDKKWARDHPSVTAAFGVLPGPEIDWPTMRRTLDWIWDNWNWPETWGWDYPMIAMCAARLGEPNRAVDALMLDTPKNHYGANGHNYQRPGLTIYLPGNGGLLYATAMMATGWDGGPKKPTPGFPKDGTWTVRWEGLRMAP
ncbi:MAG TPA: glycoside hydrolase family 65 [Verrucomicrobiae bacterium]|nr:glycoside hydrolase family 65 [Verrucomicrobiae bacterium]